MPQRVQLRRTKGWRLPAGAVLVARPSAFGNPFRVGGSAPDGRPIESRADAVRLFRSWLDGHLDADEPARLVVCARLHELRGKDLACWCPPGASCHADVLLERANARPDAAAPPA